MYSAVFYLIRWIDNTGLLTRRPSDNVLGKQGLDKQRICISKAGGEKQAASAGIVFFLFCAWRGCSSAQKYSVLHIPDAASDPHNKRNDTDKTSVSKKPSMQEVRQQHGRQTTEVSGALNERHGQTLSTEGRRLGFNSILSLVWVRVVEELKWSWFDAVSPPNTVIHRIRAACRYGTASRQQVPLLQTQ